MIRLKAIPDVIRVLGCIRRFNKYEKELETVRESGDTVRERELIAHHVYDFARDMADTVGLTVDIRGSENIPEEDGLVFISNHQGYADIIALLLAVPGRQLGFIAKDSLEKVPYFGRWIRNIRGLYIRRGDAKDALRSINEGVASIKEGFNLAIFPEGTRSRGEELGEFKSGSFKLATKAKAPIVPVAIDGTWHLFEEQGYVRPAKATVIIHPAIETKDLSRGQLAEVEQQVRETIRSSLDSLHEND